MYLMRLDDASEYMDIDKWVRMKELLDKYGIKPIYGIIPNNQDPDLLKYKKVEAFWQLMNSWQDEGWIPALHGYNHVFETSDGGINPVNARSEFAGISYENQCKKIEGGYKILKDNGICPKIFFAPAHTFDANTIEALKNRTDIRIVSDTIANDVYFKDDIFFIPQQSGRCRKLPFKLTTFCYHPNIMEDSDFDYLEVFLNKYYMEFRRLDDNDLVKRRLGLMDRILHGLYFMRRKL